MRYECGTGGKRAVSLTDQSRLFIAVLSLSIALLLSGSAGMRLRVLAAETNAEKPAGDAGKSSTCYEVFVYSFYDSDHDGIGDLQGVIRQLDYILGGGEDGLGCDMIWLMPVFPSPTYHKYDVTDFMAVDPQYGSMEDILQLIASCHERGARLILDLPLNHTSSEHPWFSEAAAYLRALDPGEEPSAEDCPYVEYYHFSREKLSGYEPLEGTGWFYEARFWSGMPDLNLDSAAVRDEISGIIQFWQELGIDGFRLDAVTSYYTENKEQSIAFVGWLTDLARQADPDCYLVGEAWTDQDTYLQYYSSGISSMFDFAFAGQEGVIASVARGSKDASWYGQRLIETDERIRSYGSGAEDAPFYTNHDMARSAGYYPQDGGARTKFALCLNLLMPGNAFLYYGEELGMSGSGKDENKRAPMQWSSDPHAEGMCIGPPEMDQVNMLYPSFEEQQGDDTSIWSCVRKAIGLRKRYPAIAAGSAALVPELSDEALCTLVRTMTGEQAVLMIVNASDREQQADLSRIREGSAAAAITDRRDSLTLTPYSVALIGEADADWTWLNEGCVLPEKKTRRRR